MLKYWENRFQSEGKVWGSEPSLSAKQASVLFESNKVETILVPGCGYGRHTDYFDRQGFEVTGIEWSNEALDIAKSESPEVKYYLGSVLDMPFSQDKYDAIYCYNVLHLFNEKDRSIFLGKCSEALTDNGVMYFTVFSELEYSFKKGIKTEKNTYESKPGRPVHYFDSQDLLGTFENFKVLAEGIIDESETHGESGNHIHKLRYIFAKKQGE